VSDATAQHLAANLKRLREARGWSQQQLADFSGVPRPTIANLESGDCNPTLSVMLRVAAALATSIERLIAGASHRFEVEQADSLPVTLIGTAVLRQLYGDASGTAIQRIELPQKAKCTISSAREGLQQIISCERGRVDISAHGEMARLRAGDVLRWHGEGVATVESLGSTSATLIVGALPIPVGA
jgi:transcriptional regulator with XRE-family HTH domain